VTDATAARGSSPRSELRIELESLDRVDVQELLDDHLQDMRKTSPPESVHALTAAELAQDGVSFWTVRAVDGTLLGCGALRQIDVDAGELKSMRTVPSARGRGVGAAMLEHLIGECRRRGYRSVHLETGSQDFFSAARRLYARAGFMETPPFGDYTHDPNSTYMGLRLH
jgi:putative acetyltransferase